MLKSLLGCLVLSLLSAQFAVAEEPKSVAVKTQAAEESLAKRLGADERGMRKYVLVILKTGPTRVADGPERDEMFRGHFANISRLSAEGTLALAGPLDGVDGWRGLFILAVSDIEEARKIVETDPVVIKGEMVPELHALYGSAALMLVPETHEKLTK
ncbi:MAG TPA: YciI family protein [Thermoanaerobaculia bacterium]